MLLLSSLLSSLYYCIVCTTSWYISLVLFAITIHRVWVMYLFHNVYCVFVCTNSCYIFFIPLCQGTCLSAYREVGIVRNSFMIIYNYRISYLYSIVVIWISLVSHIYHNFMYFYIALMIWIIFPCLSLLPNIYITVIYAFLRDTYLWVVACTLVLYPNTLVVPVSSAYFSFSSIRLHIG